MDARSEQTRLLLPNSYENEIALLTYENAREVLIFYSNGGIRGNEAGDIMNYGIV